MTNALGYFVNLVGDVVGGSVPPNFDKSTQGSSFDLVANVICENAKETPVGQDVRRGAGLYPRRQRRHHLHVLPRQRQHRS